METNFTFVALFALAALVGIATPTGLAASHEAVVEIELVETDSDEAPFAFEPGEITVEPGTTVRWVHTHDVFHTVTSTDSLDQKKGNGEFDESMSSEGDTFEVTFDEPGTYHYFCQPHSDFMFGTVVVEGEASTDAPFPGAVYLVGVLGALAVLVARRG